MINILKKNNCLLNFYGRIWFLFCQIDCIVSIFLLYFYCNKYFYRIEIFTVYIKYSFNSYYYLIYYSNKFNLQLRRDFLCESLKRFIFQKKTF